MLAMKDGFVPAKLRLAAIDFGTGSTKQAYLAVDEALKREPRNEDALLEKGRFVMTDRKPAEALAQANLVLAVNPRSLGAHYLKGAALRATGSLEESLKTFQALLQLNPGDTSGAS